MVAAGGDETVALMADGTVMAWGSNNYGQLGDGTRTNHSSPVAVPGLTGVVAVAANGWHTVALKADGTLLAWGYNGYGQLGDGTNTNRNSPAAVPGLTGVVAVAAVNFHTVALMADGTLMAWGSNNYGQLGDGTRTNHSSPVAVPGLTGVVAVAADFFSTVALKADGKVMAWGYNGYGQLGDGTKIDRSSPAAVPGLTGVVAVAAYEMHTVALKADGTVLTWGQNRHGQLGDGTQTDRSSPVAVPGLTGVVAVAAGNSHTVALKADGSVLAWGYNDYGQLGDGTNAWRSSPVAVPGLTGVVAVAAGSFHTVAVKADGTVLTWGINNNGQLGDGTNTNRNRPIAVTGLNIGLMGLTASPTSLTFATQSLGTSSAAQTLTLSNTGGSLLNIALIRVSGDYSRTTTCGPTLAAGASCSVDVTFTPTAAGTRSGTLVIDNNGVILGSLSLSGSGVGAMASLSATNLNFGLQNLGSTSAAQQATLINFGTAVLTIGSIAATGDYGVTHNCGNGLDVSGSCTLDIAFSPTATGTRTGAITVTDDAFDSPQIISLTGSGQGAVAALSATSKTFANQNLSTTSTSQSITLSNTGGLPLNLTSIMASGDFATTTNCGATLTQAASCSINVTFTPTAAGARSGTIVITSDAPSSPDTISLSGTGVPTRLVNISTRGQVQTGNNVMIGGFIIQGAAPKTVLIRAGGPSMANSVPGVLANPMLELHRSSDGAVIANNDNWSIGSSAGAIQDTGLAPVDAKESAILISLQPGAYTAIVSGVGGTNGVGIVEVFELDTPENPLINISTRGLVQTGDNVLIGGFIIQGESSKTVLIRAGGPTLAAWGVPGVLADPMLELHRSSDGAVIASSDNWGTASNAAAISATGLAPVDAKESAILITLQPGAYTAIVSGVGGATGVGIVEVFAQ